MPIQIQTPVVVASTQEKTATKIWISNLMIHAPNPNGKIRVSATLVPQTTEGELLNSLKKNLIIDDLFAEASGNQVLAQTIDSIYAAIQDQIVSKNLF